MPTPPLADRTALVTGASRGIGQAIACRLATDGALVAVHYRHDDEAAGRTVAAIEAAGGRAFKLRAELGVPGDVEAVVEQLDAVLDGRPLDVLVNNAALFAGTLDELTAAGLDRLFAVNVRAPVLLIQQLLPRMPIGGRIVNISSGVTRMAIPQVGYALTKGAVDVLTRTLARTLGPRGVTVNAVAPGVTRTDMDPGLHGSVEASAAMAGLTALGRIGEPADIADAVAFLASPDGRWVTGQVLDVDGGLFLGP